MVKPSVRMRVSDALLSILTLAEPYRNKRGEFIFEDNPELSEEVNLILIGLSNGCLEDAEERARRVLSDFDMVLDEEEIISEAEEGERGFIWGLDMHCSNLKSLVEAWIAIEFVRGWPIARTLTEILSYMNSPDTSRYWKESLREKVVDRKEVMFGKGYQRDIIGALTVSEQSVIYGSLLIASQWEAEMEGAVSYIMRRGSAFDCPLCDAECSYVRPISEPVPSFHPRCVCYPQYFYSEEEAELFR